VKRTLSFEVYYYYYELNGACDTTSIFVKYNFYFVIFLSSSSSYDKSVFSLINNPADICDDDDVGPLSSSNIIIFDDEALYEFRTLY
jgi:hypothetical protein